MQLLWCVTISEVMLINTSFAFSFSKQLEMRHRKCRRWQERREAGAALDSCRTPGSGAPPTHPVPWDYITYFTSLPERPCGREADGITLFGPRNVKLSKEDPIESKNKGEFGQEFLCYKPEAGGAETGGAQPDRVAASTLPRPTNPGGPLMLWTPHVTPTLLLFLLPPQPPPPPPPPSPPPPPPLPPQPPL